MITKKRLLIVTLILVGIVLIILLYKFALNNEELLEPVKALGEMDATLSESKLRKINNNYDELLNEYDFYEKKLIYSDTSFKYDNGLFKGRFVNNSYTYEFTFNTKNNDVSIKEISKRQIDLE